MMKKTLLIEIKDTKAVVTLTAYNGKVSLLYKKDFLFKPVEGKILFDSTWIKDMQAELLEITAFETIDNIVLIINTKGTLVKVKNVIIPLKKDLLQQVILIKNQIELQKGNLLKLIDFNTTLVNKTAAGVELSICYELVAKNLFTQIINSFLNNNIEFTKIISGVQATKHGLNNFIKDNNLIFNVSIEAKHTLISIIKKDYYLEIVKLKGGMDIIYKNIARKMNVTVRMAKVLFASFGFIPPDEVVDNKIIYFQKNVNNEKNVFRKKDLSTYITDIVNEIFNEVKGYLNKYAAQKPTLIFSGELITLIGFEHYAQIALSAPKQVATYHSNLIGVGQQDALIVDGALVEINKNIIINKGKEKIFKGDNYLFKKQHKLLCWATKINRMYNYI